MRQSSCHYQIAALVVFCIFTGSYMIKNTSIDAMATDSSLISLRNLLSSFTLSLFLSLCLTHTHDAELLKLSENIYGAKPVVLGNVRPGMRKIHVCVCMHMWTHIYFIYSFYLCVNGQLRSAENSFNLRACAF